MNFSIEQGIEKLEAMLLANPSKQLPHADVKNLQEDIKRLNDLLEEERLYGPAPNTTQERFKLIERLNHFMLVNYNPTTFNDLCRDEE